MSGQGAGRVLLVEDDGELASAIETSLRLAGHDVEMHSAAAAALAAVDVRFAGVIVSDLRMPGMDGWQFFRALRAIDAELPVIFITGHGDIDEAVSALQQGAYDFVAKPFAAPRLLASVARAVETRRLVLDNRRLRADAEGLAETGGGALGQLLPLAGESAVMEALRATLAHVGEADIDVLIEAEAGTGRDKVARLLHDASRRRAQAFASVNCAAANADLLAVEIFGEARDAASRSRQRTGRLEFADRGTLFLDAVEALPDALQMRLLSTLDSGELVPLGSNAARRLDVRVIAATSVDLGAAVAEGRFRAELLVRLGALRLRIPPLRERREDIPLLFGRLAADAARRFSQPLPAISAAVRAHLLGHDWPGNLRELGHFADRFVLGLVPGAAPADAEANPTLADQMARIEAGLLREALAAAGGQIGEVMRVLGLPRKTLYDKLARHGIDPAEYRRRPAEAR
jgi:two-component system C4-dicarboxylate transport response regulator DctD